MSGPIRTALTLLSVLTVYICGATSFMLVLLYFNITPISEHIKIYLIGGFLFALVATIYWINVVGHFNDCATNKNRGLVS